MKDDNRMAIIGMACIFPGSQNLSSLLENLEKGYDAIEPVPNHRLDKVFYDPEAMEYDRFYCQRGGFIDSYATFDPYSYGIMPVAAKGAEPDQLLALKVSHDALIDAGYNDTQIPGHQTGIIIGRGNYPGPGRLRLEQQVKTAQQLANTLQTLVPGISDDEINRVKTEFQGRVGHFGPDTAIGMVPNLTASRVANRLDLHGPAFTIDAACASSLIAIDQAVKILQNRQCDLMLAGGIHLCHDEAFWSVFTQLGVLSPSGTIRPFDEKADGILIGEGVGIVVIKRYRDAIRDNDRIYSIIHGVGISSDGRSSSLMQPDVNGQVAALKAAWQVSGLNPQNIGCIEGHGTGAPTGDASELKALSKCFPNVSNTGPKPVLGSIKSMIGHCMPAAGIAGVIKASLSIYHKKLFPSIHCHHPNKAIRDTCFRVISQTEPWHPSDVTRIAGVNAFGFGGINAHLVLSAHKKIPNRVMTVTGKAAQPIEKVLLIGAPSREALFNALEAEKTTLHKGAFRLAIFNPDANKLKKARKIIENGRPWRGRGDIFFSSDGLALAGGKTVFLFPGVDEQFSPRLENMDSYFQKPLPEYKSSLEGLGKTGLDIIRTNLFLYSILISTGLKPDLIAGHSIGEWSGMIAAGIVEQNGLDAFIRDLESDAVEMPDVSFAAAGCGIHKAYSFIQSMDDISVSNDNCPHQVILCGKDSVIDTTISRMKQSGILCQKLSFKSGFHSPLFENSLQTYRRNIEKINYKPMKTTMWSATTCKPYPKDMTGVKQLVIDHLVKPVRFRELILELHRRGARIFIQVGTGSLTGFVQDTLHGRSFSAIQTNTPNKTGMQQLRRAVAACFIEGIEPDLALVGMMNTSDKAFPPSRHSEIRLSLSAPLVHLDTPLNRSGNRINALVKSEENRHPVMTAYQDTLKEIAHMQEEVLQGWHEATSEKDHMEIPNKSTEKQHAMRSTFKANLSLETCPWLIDHSLYPQDVSCISIHEKYPVVPMTMSIDLICEYAQKMAPHKKVISVENIQAFKWMDVCIPLDLEITAEHLTAEKIKVEIKGYLTGIARVSTQYPQPPSLEKDRLHAKHNAIMNGPSLYRDRWMFHGSAYQGIREINTIDDNGISGVISAVQGRGSLLDNAGQLFGYWVMVKGTVNKLAMPIKIGKVEFYSNHPENGVEVACRVRCYPMKRNAVTADMELVVAGTTWATITGWENRRFEIDNTLFAVLRHPGNRLLSSVEDNGIVVYRDLNTSASARDFLSRRYCTAFEKTSYDKIAPKEKRQWLSRLIAIKDAVRNHLLTHGAKSVFPAQVVFQHDNRPELCQAIGPDGEHFTVKYRFGEASCAAVIIYYKDQGHEMTTLTGSTEQMDQHLITALKGTIT